MDAPTRETVLVVEDDRELADLYADSLRPEYEVRTAHTGGEALAALDPAVDVVLLDRRLPDLPGERVLERIRAQQSRCQVAMVTAVEPDVDTIEMGFDDYVRKPIAGDRLRRVVDRLLVRRTYDAKLREYAALVSKRALLEAEAGPGHRDSAEYADLQARIAELEASIDATLQAFEGEDFDAAFRTVMREAGDRVSV